MAVSRGTTLLEAVRAAGIDLPYLCHHPRLPASGCCRLCLVQISGQDRPVPSCATEAKAGVEVRTAAPELVEARQANLVMLRARCSSDCPSCLRSGQCRLEALCLKYGVRPGSSAIDRAAPPVENQFFFRDNSKCVLCRRCVVFCDRVQGTGALAVYGRGERNVILADEPACVSCGNCVALCPAGALTHRYEFTPGRRIPDRWVETVCGYCGVGCRLELGVAGEKIVGVRPADGPANRGFLCVKGAYGWGFIHHPERLTRPLIRRSGAPRGRADSFEPATWGQALDLVAVRLAAIRDGYGPEAVGGLASAKCTNEENYLFQKLFRQGLGTNNIDHCARL